MSDIPRWYYRIKNAFFCFNQFEELKEDYDKQIYKSCEDRQKLLDLIKSIFVYYWKTLRDFLKEDGIRVYLPRKILSTAQKRHLINNSSVWLHYIDLLNQLCREKDVFKQSELADKILNEYSEQIFLLKDFFNKKYKSIKVNYDKETSLYIDKFPDNEPSYTCGDIGIKEQSYELFLSYLKNRREIKTVWLHGSRAEGNARDNTDIDLVIDSPLDTFEELQTSMKKIRIPYRIDSVNIHNEDNRDFLSVVCSFAKIIYRSSDFED